MTSAPPDAAAQTGGTGPGEDRRLLLVATGAAAVLLGSTVGGQQTLVFAVVMSVAALPLVNARPVVLIGLGLAVTWTSRLFTTTGFAPRFLDFLDFPLVLAAFVVATVTHLASGRALPPSQRRVVRILGLVAAVLAISWAFNDLNEPQRLVAGLVFALEPFLLLVAVIVAPMTERERRALLVVTIVVLCGQLPFSLAQMASGAVADSVKGTLLQAGAGHHVSAGGLVLGFFVLAGLHAPKAILAAYGAASLVVVVVSDTKQVLFVLPLALLVLGLSRRRSGSVAGLARGLVAGLLMAAVAAYALLSYQASSTAFDFLENSATNRTGKIAVTAALWEDLGETAPSLAFGLGPGQSVSRFAFLTTPALFKVGSPVAMLGLSTSRGAEAYDDIAFGGRYTGGSSFTSAQSSALGILGDYGLAGVVVFGWMIFSVITALRREGAPGLRAAALACWALVLPLAVVFDWLEQPPFTLAIMVVTGLALRTPDTLEPSDAPATAPAESTVAPAHGALSEWHPVPTRSSPPTGSSPALPSAPGPGQRVGDGLRPT